MFNWLYFRRNFDYYTKNIRHSIRLKGITNLLKTRRISFFIRRLRTFRQNILLVTPFGSVVWYA